MLVAYFSLAGEQYGVGVIEEGNTSIIAHMIAEQTGADLFEIKPETPYPNTYQGLLDVSQQEMRDNARPQIADTVDNMDDYASSHSAKDRTNQKCQNIHRHDGGTHRRPRQNGDQNAQHRAAH